MLGRSKGILYGFLLSVTVELLQYVFCLGYCEMDDVLHNTIGAAIGVLAFKAIHLLLRKSR